MGVPSHPLLPFPLPTLYGPSSQHSAVLFLGLLTTHYSLFHHFLPLPFSTFALFSFPLARDSLSTPGWLLTFHDYPSRYFLVFLSHSLPSFFLLTLFFLSSAPPTSYLRFLFPRVHISLLSFPCHPLRPYSRSSLTPLPSLLHFAPTTSSPSPSCFRHRYRLTPPYYPSSSPLGRYGVLQPQ